MMTQVFTGPPTITTHPSNQSTICSSASFTCIAHGFEIKITWRRVNYDLPISVDVTQEKSLNGFSSTLKLTKIVGYYSGQYYCVAENKAGIVTSKAASLHVQSNINRLYMHVCLFSKYIKIQ